MAEVLSPQPHEPQQHQPSSTTNTAAAATTATTATTTTTTTTVSSSSPLHPIKQQQKQTPPPPLHTSPQPQPHPRHQDGHHPDTQLQRQSNGHIPSRPPSTLPPTPMAQIRDFAYAPFHPMHYGPPPPPTPPAPSSSGTSTPASEWPGHRRLSDPWDGGAASGIGHNNSNWSAGPWGGDGALFDDVDDEGEALPSTSFGDDEGPRRGRGQQQQYHRKSKSYADVSDYERGRRRGESAGWQGQRRSRGEEGGGGFLAGGAQSDPAGRESLRLSRGYGYPTTTSTTTSDHREGGGGWTKPAAAGQSRQHQLSPRTFTTSSRASSTAESDSFPLDAEDSPPEEYPPFRSSLGPDDENLYAGRSLALYPFEPENGNELRLAEGQVIMVAYRHGQGWLVAEDPQTGEQGLVPEAYVRLLSDLPHFDPETGEFADVEGEGAKEEEEMEEEDVDDDDDDDGVGIVPVGEDGGVAVVGEDQEGEDGRVDEGFEVPDEPLVMKRSR